MDVIKTPREPSQQRAAGQTVDVPMPQTRGETEEAPMSTPQERIQQRSAGQIADVPEIVELGKITPQERSSQATYAST